MTHRLLWITEHYFPGRGGMAVACDRIVYGLRNADVTVDLVHVRRGSEPARTLSIDTRQGGRDWNVPLDSDAAHAANVLWPILEREAVTARWTHVVAFGGSFPLLVAPTYAAWLNLPLILLLRGNDFDLGAFTPGRRGALDDAISRAARVYCVTESLANRVASLYSDASVAWVPNGIDREGWSALPSDRERSRALRDEFESASAPAFSGVPHKVVGLFGNLKAKKGVPFLQDQIAVSGLGSRLHLLLVGEPEPGVRERLAEVPALTSTVLPPMARTELIPYLLACDCVALPSYYDGFPNVLLEAAALGVPLLASDAGGAGVLRDGVEGAIFPAGDPAGCQAALIRFVTASPEELERWKAACHALAARFSAATETVGYRRGLDETVRRARGSSERSRVAAGLPSARRKP